MKVKDIKEALKDFDDELELKTHMWDMPTEVSARLEFKHVVHYNYKDEQIGKCLIVQLYYEKGARLT